MDAQSQSAPNRNVGRPLGAVGARGRRQQLVKAYVDALGGADHVSQIQMAEVMRVVDMTLLAQGMRTKALRGEAIDIGDLTRLEGAVSRVIRSLNLPPPGAAPVQTFADYLAGQHAADNEGEG